MDNGEPVIHRVALCPQAPQPSIDFDKNFKVKTDDWPVNDEAIRFLDIALSTAVLSFALFTRGG